MDRLRELLENPFTWIIAAFAWVLKSGDVAGWFLERLAYSPAPDPMSAIEPSLFDQAVSHPWAPWILGYAPGLILLLVFRRKYYSWEEAFKPALSLAVLLDIILFVSAAVMAWNAFSIRRLLHPGS